jgi:hypothetical protein
MMLRPAAPLVCVAILACRGPLTTVELRGRVLEGPAEDAPIVGGADVQVRDSSGADYAAATAEGDGTFAVDIPATAQFRLELRAAGHLPTAFTGYSLAGDVEAPDGTLFARPVDFLDGLRATFGNCPKAAEPGAVIEGELRLFLPVGEDTDELPLVNTGTVAVVDADGASHTPCYLDNQGISLAEGAVTGDTGRFAFFGLPPGLATFTSAYTLNDISYDGEPYDLLLPAEGIAPLYPAWVDAPN